jgi:chemotaxis signal transduction protein
VAEPSLQLRAGGRTVHLRLAQARRVVRTPPLVRAPGAAAGVLGVLSSGGQTVPVVDLGRLTDGAPVRNGRVVLADSGTGPVGLAVDAVAGVGETSSPFDLDAALAPLLQPAREAGAGAAHAAPPQPEAEAEAESFALFQVGGRTVAVPLARLAGVSALRPDELAARRLLRDGDAIPVLAPATAADPSRAALLDGRTGPFALAVDAAGPVVRPSIGRIDPVPSRLGPGLAAVVRLEGGQLVGVLDVDALEPERPAPPPAAPVTAGVTAAGLPVLVIEGGGRRWALPTAAVSEVLKAPELVRAPGTARGIAGVLARAGAVVPVLATGGGRTGGWVVLTRFGADPVGLLCASRPRPDRLAVGAAPRLFAPAALASGDSATVLADDGEGGVATRLLVELERAA